MVIGVYILLDILILTQRELKLWVWHLCLCLAFSLIGLFQSWVGWCHIFVAFFYSVYLDTSQTKNTIKNQHENCFSKSTNFLEIPCFTFLVSVALYISNNLDLDLHLMIFEDHCKVNLHSMTSHGHWMLSLFSILSWSIFRKYKNLLSKSTNHHEISSSH